MRSPFGFGVSDTRMVSPIPSASRIDRPAVLATMPFVPIPASVKPEVQRVVAARGEPPIDVDEILNAGHLRRNDDLVVAKPDSSASSAERSALASIASM